MAKASVSFEPRFGGDLGDFINPIGSVKRHPDNPYKHPAKQIVKIQESLMAHGQQSLLVVQASTGYIVKGNGTHEAAEKIGWDRIAYRIEDMNDEQAMAYLIADNESSKLQQVDAQKQSKVLHALADGPGLQGTLFEVEDLVDLDEATFGATVVDPGTFTGGFASDDRPEDRAAKEATPGTKMKEVPLVMSVAEHQLFLTQIRDIASAMGTKGNVQTIIAAVRFLAEDVAGRGKALPPASAAEAKLQLLQDLIIHFDEQGETFTGGEVAVYLQGVHDALEKELPKAPVKELPGQTHISDVVEIDQRAQLDDATEQELDEQHGLREIEA